MQRIEDGYREPGYDGLRPDESLAALTAEIHSFVDAQYRCWNDRLLPELRKQGIRLLEWDELDDEARELRAELLPARSRSAADADLDRSCASVSARAEQGALPGAAAAPKRRSSGPQVLGVVTVPRALPRFVRLPCRRWLPFDYLLLQDLIAQNLAACTADTKCWRTRPFA